MDTYKLTATQVLDKYKSDELTVEQYAESLLARVRSRDPTVKAWAYLDPELVLAQARALDQLPKDKRGPLHGVAVGVKDVIYTKGLCKLFQYMEELTDGRMLALRYADSVQLAHSRSQLSQS